MAFRASPSLRSAKAVGASRPLMRKSRILALFCAAPSPSSHTTGKASSAVLARHQVSATTATVASSTRTTPRTPGRPFTASASKLTSLPPNTGQARIAALSMPGSLRSMAKTLLPLVLFAESSRLKGWPATVQLRGSFSLMALLSGAGSLAASAASSP